jgi:hypothetical protein
MTRKRFVAGLIFGLFMMIFMFILLYASGEYPRNLHLAVYSKRAVIAGIASGVIYGSLLGRFAKKKFD